MPNSTPFEPLDLRGQNSESASETFYNLLSKRRSVRMFSDEEVSEKTIENILKTAGTAPSGANKQPWFFCAVSNKKLKHIIRNLAEKEEQVNYNTRMSERWKEDLKKFGTNAIKEFIDIAPWLIIVMRKPYEIGEKGEKINNYYVNESIGIATGLLITAIHQAGLVTLTHTPSPMDFLTMALNRPENEKPFILLPVGYAEKNASVPNIQRKDISEIVKYYR